MEVTTEEVFAVLDKLLENLGLQLEEYDFVFLTQAELYVEMFKLMFPTLGPMLEVDFSQEDIDDEELIQSLLDFLSQYIIKVDLDHISSSLITQGDPKHILNLLQLIYEISKMVIAKEGEEEEGEGEGEPQSEPSGKVVGEKFIRSSPNSLKQLSDNSQRSSIGEWQAAKYHTAQGIPEEFIDMIAEEEEQAAALAHAQQQAEHGAMMGHTGNHHAAAKQQQQGREYRKQQDAYDNPYRPRTDSQRDSYSGSRISEVSKSKEFSDYELNTKKKSALGRRSEEPTSEDFERLRNYDAHKKHKQQVEGEEEMAEEEDYGDEVEVEEEEEEELQDMPEDESDRYVSIRERSHHNQKIASHLEGGEIEHEHEEDQEEHEGQEEEEDDEGEYEYVYEDEYGNIHRHIPGQEEVENEEDAEYYASDPIDYNSIKAKEKAAQQQHHQEEEDEEEEPEEGEEGHEGGEYEYQYGHEEPQSGVEESHAESEDHQLEPNYVQQQEIDQQNYYYEQAKMAVNKSAKKGKAKGKKARPQTAKTQTRPVTAQTYKKPEVQYRALRPVTGNFVPPQTKKVSTKKKTTQSTDKKPVKKSFVQRDSENQSERSNTENMHPKYQTHSRNSKQDKSSRRTSHADEEQQKYARSQQQIYRPSQARKSVKIVKPVRIKGETLTSAFEAQQSMLYDRIRDEKLDYLKKIHKIIYQLDKKRTLEERKAYMDYRRSIDEDTIGMMLTLKQNYKDKIDNLKRGHLNDRNERKMTDLTQKMFIQTLKQELNLDQMKEIERLRNRWSNEKLRFEMMTQDENFLEKRLVDLYKK